MISLDSVGGWSIGESHYDFHCPVASTCFATGLLLTGSKMSVTLLDARSDSLTVTWPRIKQARRYILEFRTSETAWERLSDDIRQTQVRKRHLDPNFEYFFRVAAVFNDGFGEWLFHEEGFFPLTQEAEEYAMAPPRVRNVETECLAITWDRVRSAYAYELQMRENIGGAEWLTVGDNIETTEVIKRRLISRNGYMFRVRPLNGEYDEAFSAPSDTKLASPVMKTIRDATIDPKATDDYSMAAPWVKNAGPQALLLHWVQFDGATGYEIQMRENNRKGKWVTIAEKYAGTQVKKNNLTSINGYQFRVRPLGTRESRFSAPSYGAVASQASARNSR